MNCHKHKRLVCLIVLIATFVCLGMPAMSPAAENRGKSAPASALPKELKGVSVKDYFLPGTAREAGIVQTAMGHVVVARGDLRQAYFAANGDKLYEGDVIFTLKASRCRLKLHNNDVVTIAESSRLAVRQVLGKDDPKGKNSSMTMSRGKAMFYAIRTLGGKPTAMTVNSPTAVIGVRGTKFGIDVTEDGEQQKGKEEQTDQTQSAMPLLLADNSPDWGRYIVLAQAGIPGMGGIGGAGSSGGAGGAGGLTTTVHSFDGTITVAGTTGAGAPVTLSAGMSLSAGPLVVGAPMPTPPAVSQRFQSVTNVPPPPSGGGGGTSGGTVVAGSGSSGSTGGTSGGTGSSSGSTSSGGTSGGSSSSGSSGGSGDTSGSSGGTTGLASTGTGTGPTSTTTLPTNLASIPQEQNANQAPQNVTPAATTVTDPMTNATGSSVGYFASIISNLSSTPSTMAEVFASKNRYNGDSNVWARGLTNPGTDYIRVLGNSGSGFASTPTMKWMVLGAGTKDSGEVSKSVISVDLGKSQYMNWGYATVPDSVVINDISYVNDNWTYWLFGKNANALPSQSATYRGSAYGTYWTSGGGVNMTGFFTTSLNMTSYKIENFNLSVANSLASKSASITGASGSIASDTTFSLDTTSGSWYINGSPALYKSASGSLYGNTDMGGIWAMRTSTDAAVGNFQGYSNFPTGATIGTQQGHIVGMMDKYDTGAKLYYYVDTYMTSALQDFANTPNPKAYNPNSTYSIEIEGTTGWPKNMKAASAASLTAWTGSLPVSFNLMGSQTLGSTSEYIEWGYWTQTQGIVNSSYPPLFQQPGGLCLGNCNNGCQYHGIEDIPGFGNLQRLGMGDDVQGRHVRCGHVRKLQHVGQFRKFASHRLQCQRIRRRELRQHNKCHGKPERRCGSDRHIQHQPCFRHLADQRE